MDSIAPTIEDLEELITGSYKNPNLKLIREAYNFAEKVHGQTMRDSGHPYITHPVATACRLAEMNLGLNVVAAGLLHDVMEDGDVGREELEKKFGSEIANLVEAETKLRKAYYKGIERYSENMRRMFLAMATDVRVVFIKFADRLHNLKTLYARPIDKQRRTSQETLDIYGPIAGRLGMREIKGELEDAAFSYAYPEDYLKTLEIYEAHITPLKPYVDELIEKICQILDEADINYTSVHGRAKRLYSLYKKLKRKDNDIEKVHDLIAVRIIINDVADCYAVLGIMHNRWAPMSGRIKDYISQPKPNGYQSLHTTVFCDRGHIVELQIRTQEMHELAEYGVAAHWRFKETGSNKVKTVEWMEELAKIQKEISDKKDYLDKLEKLKIDIFQDRIFVFTPKGDVMDLPEEATPVDFAYAIHTDIGDKAVAAKINEKMVNLDTALKSGDMCEIVVDKNRKGPNADWLKFVKTNQARQKIKNATKKTMKGWLREIIHH
ncbi:MAG: RelA/SpoT family protein [Candidatus Uhrbacteria bacterium]